MLKQTLTCDYCESDLSYTKGEYKHSLILRDRTYGPKPGSIVFGVHIPPHINQDKDFCNFDCLEKWLENEKINRNQ